MQRITTARSDRLQFRDLPDLVDFCANEPKQWSYSASHDYNGSSWDLGANYDKALQLARTGWEDGVRNIAALAATVPNQRITTREYSIAGETPDVPRYLAGDPFCMQHRGKMRTPKPAVTICVSIGANCNVKAQCMANFGAAMVALVDRLESRNVRVEVLGCWTSQLPGCDFAASWTVKRCEDALDLSAVAFSLGHPAMLRRLGFAVMERIARKWQNIGYGHSREMITAKDFVDVPEGALFIGGCGSSNQCATMAGALAYAKQTIARAYKLAGHGDAFAELEDGDA